MLKLAIAKAHKTYLDNLLGINTPPPVQNSDRGNQTETKTKKRSPSEFEIKHHDCTGDCNFFVCGDVYICELTGDYHICTSAECSAFELTREHRVCRLTGIAYSLDFEERQFEDSYNLEEYGYAEREVVEELDTEVAIFDASVSMATSQFSIGDVGGGGRDPSEEEDADPNFVDTDLQLEKIIDSGKPLQKRQKKRRAAKWVPQTRINTQHDRLEGEFINIFESLLEVDNKQNAVVDPTLKRRVSMVSLLLWITILNSEYLKNCPKKRVYRSDYHALVVFFAMMKGIQWKGKWVVPKEEAMSELLPLSSKIRTIGSTRVKFFKIKWFTNYDKQFRTTLKNITDDEWHVYCQGVQRHGVKL